MSLPTLWLRKASPRLCRAEQLCTIGAVCRVPPPAAPRPPGPVAAGTLTSAAGTLHTPAALHPPWAPRHLLCRSHIYGRASLRLRRGWLRARHGITVPWQWTSLTTTRPGESQALRRDLRRAVAALGPPPTAGPLAGGMHRATAAPAAQLTPFPCQHSRARDYSCVRSAYNGSPPERHGAGLGPWYSACRHIANRASLSDARGLLRAEMSPECRPRGVSPQGRL